MIGCVFEANNIGLGPFGCVFDGMTGVGSTRLLDCSARNIGCVSVSVRASLNALAAGRPGTLCNVISVDAIGFCG